jgi:heme exporter protein A
LLHAEGLACARGDRVLWRRVALSLRAGEALHVIGANGIGKSSLIRLVAGLLPAAHGTVTLAARAALVDENPALDRDLAVGRALAFWAALDGGGTDAVPAALARLGIGHLAEVPVRFLSTGQRKRAALARLIASDAPLWLLDEPGNGLDRDGLALLETLVAAHRAQGGAVLLASHLPLAMAGAAMLDLSAHRP